MRSRPFAALFLLASLAVGVVVAVQAGVAWGVGFVALAGLYVVTRLDLWD
jgi:hypothetical protein